jgi:4-amino-4-deoxy-L-arabinose transferase-like glycosyltransferase
VLRDAAVVLAGCALLAALALDSARRESAVYDEPVHLAAGYTAGRFGEFRINPDHPPLVARLAALPLLAMDVRFPADDAAWALGRPYEVGRRLLYRWNDGDRLLLRARAMIVLLACALVTAVYACARRRHGRAGAAVALVAAATSPDLVAHGHYVTTDLGIALFLFLSVMAFERVAERATPARVALLGLAAGAAFATKFSALILGPVLLVLAAAEIGRAPAPARRAQALRLAGALAVTALVAWGVVWSAYGWRFAASEDAAVRARIPWDRLRPEPAALAAALDGARAARVLPEPYLWGFARFFEHVQARPAFLLGERSDEGFLHFFPVTFATKTPLALAALLGIAGWTAARRGAFRGDLYVAVPVALYGAASLAQGINIGHRHLLPLYPFLFVFAGRAGAWAASAWPRRAPAAAVGALGAWLLAAALWVHPHHLAYFNEAAGGPAHGWRIAVDSSLDWGQDLKALPAYMQAHGIARVKLSYFGTADPAYYGIAHDQLPSYLPWPRPTVTEVRPGDVLAVSATNLQGVYLDAEARALMDRIRREPPAGRVGYSILVYRADFTWPGP